MPDERRRLPVYSRVETTKKLRVTFSYVIGNKQLLRRLRVRVHPWWEKIQASTEGSWHIRHFKSSFAFHLATPCKPLSTCQKKRPFQQKTASYSEAVNFHFNGLMFNTLSPSSPSSLTLQNISFHIIVSLSDWEIEERYEASSPPSSLTQAYNQGS